MALEKPASPVDFVGETGPGAEIDLYLPQPGQHVGQRLLKIEDVPAEYFRDNAPTAGVAWGDYFGLEKSDEIWQIKTPEALTAQWFGRFTRARRTRPTRPVVLGPLQASLNTGARAAMTQGSVVGWTRGGAAVTARLSSAPDAAGNTDPLPLDVPEPDVSKPTPEQEAASDFVIGITQIAAGAITIPVSGWGGIHDEVTVDLDQPPAPALFLVQVVGISSFLGDYGLGRTVKTFTLLPGETTTIHTRTWRATEESVSQASSIIDSYDESASERFAETVLNETTDTATRESTENWHVEADARASIGLASASVSGGGGGEYTSGTEEFAKALDEAVREHAAEASSHRENTVTSSSESSVSTEDETVVERTIKNINVSRVLNFTFRELNQQYVIKTHLKEVRVAFSNGNAESWREEPISGLRTLVEEVILPQHVDQVCSDIIGTIALVRNVQETPVGVLEQVLLDDCGLTVLTRNAEPGDGCRYSPPLPRGELYYRFKRGHLGQRPDEDHPVDGVVLSERTVVMATDSVVVEALLGTKPALDDYSEQLQREAIREKRLANNREELAQRIVAGAKTAEAELYERVFGVCCTTTDAEPAEAAEGGRKAP
jgi:hypothetical protein